MVMPVVDDDDLWSCWAGLLACQVSVPLCRPCSPRRTAHIEYSIQFLAADAPDGRCPASVQHELATPLVTDSDVHLPASGCPELPYPFIRHEAQVRPPVDGRITVSARKSPTLLQYPGSLSYL